MVAVGVTVPEGVRGGDTVAIRVGQDHHDAVVPDGLTPGMRFEITLEVDAVNVHAMAPGTTPDDGRRYAVTQALDDQASQGEVGQGWWLRNWFG